MKKDYINLHLHMFDGGAAGGAEGGGDGAASTQESGAEPTVVYGKDPAADDSTSQVGSDEGGDDPDGNEPEEDIDAEFEELIKGKYKQQFDGRVHSIMQNRFKNAQDVKDVAAKWQGATAGYMMGNRNVEFSTIIKVKTLILPRIYHNSNGRYGKI